MRSTTGKIWAQPLGLAMIFGLLAGCESGDDEQAVLSVVNDAAALLEEGNVTRVLHLTTKDFLAQPGRLNRKAVTSRLLGFFRDNGDIVILHPAVEVEIRDSGKAALVSSPFVAAKLGVSREKLDALADDPEAWEKEAGKYTAVEHAEISLVKTDGIWRVSSVRF